MPNSSVNPESFDKPVAPYAETERDTIAGKTVYWPLLKPNYRFLAVFDGMPIGGGAAAAA
jgi:hypothetical protein